VNLLTEACKTKPGVYPNIISKMSLGAQSLLKSYLKPFNLSLFFMVLLKIIVKGYRSNINIWIAQKPN
jgi:hypothetical protein